MLGNGIGNRVKKLEIAFLDAAGAMLTLLGVVIGRYVCPAMRRRPLSALVSANWKRRGSASASRD